jgi:hemerythrin-like domain-containing protein
MNEDVVDRIEHDHREVEGMFGQFKDSHDRTLAMKICDELDKHTKAEEQAVYPVFKEELSDESDAVVEAVQEHKEARQLIGRVRNTQEDEHLVALMAELEQEIAHHVHEEESEMLPKAREELPAEELSELGNRFEEAKSSA